MVIDKIFSTHERRKLDELVAEILGWTKIKLKYGHLKNGDRVGIRPGGQWPNTPATLPKFTENHNAFAEVEAFMAREKELFEVFFYPARPDLLGLLDMAEQDRYAFHVRSKERQASVDVIHRSKLVAGCIAFVIGHAGRLTSPYCEYCLLNVPLSANPGLVGYHDSELEDGTPAFAPCGFAIEKKPIFFGAEEEESE